MDTPKRALTYNQAKELGLIFSDYTYQNTPTDFVATLKFKVWGKKNNLQLFFECDDGAKYVMSVFARNYAPKMMPEFDLSVPEIQPGLSFQLITGLNKNGNTNLLEAHLIE